MVNTGSELTVTLSAHKGYNVKTLTIGGTAYSVVSNKRITTKVKITKATSISGIIEAETNPAPKNPGQGNSNPPGPGTPEHENSAPNPSNPTPTAKYKVTVTQPANGAIEVTPALPADGMVNTATELTFTLSAHTNYKVKTLTINGTTYSAVTDNTITQKVKIEKNTAVSATLETASNPTPDAGTFTDTQGNNVTIEPVKAYGGEITGYRLAGDIYIEELNSEAFKAKLNTLNGKELYTDSLNINCFTSQNSTITAKEITPKLLTGVLTIGKEKNFSAFKLNNKATDTDPINIPFESTIEKPFDISDLAKFSFSKDFKLATGSKIILGSTATKKTSPGGYDITSYPKIHELLKLLNNKKLKNDISVKDVYVTGNVKDLLPLLVEGPNKIKEVDGGIKFLNHVEVICPGPNVTKYDGGKDNNTPLPLEQFIEFSKRTNEHHDSVIDKQTRPLDIDNLILKDINTTTINEEQLQFLHFNGNLTGGKIIFKDSNLSKMEYRGTTGPSNVIFENTTLPYTMQSSSIERLTLKNVTFPQEEFYKTGTFEDLPYAAPGIGTLTIHGEVKNSPLKDLTQEQIEKLKKDTQKPREMPRVYKGSQEIYDRLKYIYRGESHTKEFINLQGSIQKPQDTFLALLGNSKAHG